MTISSLVPSPAGPLSHNDVREKINELIDRANNGLPSLLFGSTSTIPSTGGISNDLNNPTYMDSLELIDQSGGFELVATGPAAGTGAVLNNTGFDLAMIGSFDLYPDNDGGTSRIELWSEISIDGGATWTENPKSARRIEVGNASESTQTKSSRISLFPHLAMIRFAMYDSGTGSLTLLLPSFEANSPGNIVEGYSFAVNLASTRIVT